jgi:hypothetical protein
MVTKENPGFCPETANARAKIVAQRHLRILPAAICSREDSPATWTVSKRTPFLHRPGHQVDAALKRVWLAGRCNLGRLDRITRA